MNMKSSSMIAKQITLTKAELKAQRPRSRRHVQLELRLRDLVVRQLKCEMKRTRHGSLTIAEPLSNHAGIES